MNKVIGKRISKLLRAYYMGPDHPMKLRFYWMFRRLSGYARLTIPYANGGWITVDERDSLQGQIFTTGSYEHEVWEKLSTFATSDETVWDIGAHIGSFAIKALLDLRVKEVHAFEPDPMHADVLTLNLALNKGRYRVHRFALSDRREFRKLYHGLLPNTGLSSLATQMDNEVFEVECRTAVELVFQEDIHPPTLIKIDVEGWEFHVLKGAQRIFTEFPPKAIVFESECDESGEILDKHLLNYLAGLGYEVQWIRRPSGIVEQRENFLAVYKTFDK